MKKWITTFIKECRVPLMALLFLAVWLPVHAETVVTVSNNQPAMPQTVIIRQTPMVVTQEAVTGDFEGRIVEINASQNLIVVHSADGKDRQVLMAPGTIATYRLGDYVQIRQAAAPMVITQQAITGDYEGTIVEVNAAQGSLIVRDSSGTDRQVLLRPELVNSYRIGDYVQIRPMTDLTVVTVEENPKDFEGEIIRVDIPKGQIIVQDTYGRQRRVQLKQGMIGQYSVDDYVRVHLMADLKEAKTIETVRDIVRFDGSVVRVDAPASRLVIHDSHGNERIVLVRQGTINGYQVGNQVRIYQLANRQDVQLVRIMRVS